MPRPSPSDAKATDLIQLIGAPSRTDSLARGCGRTLIAGPSRPALLDLLGELGAWEHRLASEAATTADPVMAAETRGAVHALALVVEAAAEAARSTSVPTNEVLLAELIDTLTTLLRICSRALPYGSIQPRLQAHLAELSTRELHRLKP